MRILFVDTTTHSKEIGGGHLILPALMGALVKRNHEVHLVMAAPANPKLDDLIKESRAIVHIAPWKKKGPVLDLVPSFNTWINSINPDIYVISCSAAIGWLVLPLLSESLPTYTIGHNDEKTFYLPVKHYHNFLSGAIGVSKQICDTYIRDCNMRAQAVTWIPYGVHVADEIRKTNFNSPLRLIYAGRIEIHQKRIMDLATILKTLRKNKVSYICDIVGDGPDMKIFREQLVAEEKNGQVVFHGWLGKNDVLSAFTKADVFLLTSAFEGFSISLTEAMANGCCPVVTNIKAGNQQLIESGLNGFLVELGDLYGFVSTISSLAENRDKLSQLRMHAWNTGKAYSLDRMAQKYEELFLRDSSKDKSKIANRTIDFPIMPTTFSRYPMWLRRIKALFDKMPEV